jgi:hypothetical protein
MLSNRNLAPGSALTENAPKLLPPANVGIPRGRTALWWLLRPYALRVDYSPCYPFTCCRIWRYFGVISGAGTSC